MPIRMTADQFRSLEWKTQESRWVTAEIDSGAMFIGSPDDIEMPYELDGHGQTWLSTEVEGEVLRLLIKWKAHGASGTSPDKPFYWADPELDLNLEYLAVGLYGQTYVVIEENNRELGCFACHELFREIAHRDDWVPAAREVLPKTPADLLSSNRVADNAYQATGIAPSPAG